MARILVADDEQGLRDFVAGVLEREGHQVRQAADGQEALEMLAAQHFHLVITDLRMPRIDGSEVLARVRQEWPETEVIVLTAHGTVDSAVEAMKLGAFEYLQKPISGPPELRLLVRRALERHDLVSLQERATRDETADEPRLSYGDPVMQPIEDAIRKVARTNSTVLLSGESGTGKEVAARLIHRASERADRPFVAINAAALPENLLESELFGHEKGAFTGADQRRRGRLELADGGTFFLDEVGELKPELQAKLLRVLQERTFERIGGNQTIEANVRWIAATNRDLLALIDEGTFREDLYHRLAVFPIQLPPLRERPGDILPMAEALVRRLSRQLGVQPPPIAADARKALAANPWRGNARGLANTLERALILSEGGEIRGEHLSFPPASSATPSSAVRPLDDIERDAIRAALAASGGNRKRAAESLGIGLRTLYDKLKRYDL